MQIDPRILAAAAAAQPQWNPVVGFLVPVYAGLLQAATMDGGLPEGKAEARDRAQRAWEAAIEAFARLGFTFVPPLGCRPADNYGAALRDLDEAVDAAIAAAKGGDE